ncbi:outer membrane protein transport protein [Vibrio sp. LaRot3]|uniref:outer membrane protein transport protein n=1 Tax=Vibrio sp. LaRot3 TaxID=2998829 RepID=UPI0022CE1697|nr:outer membrane protein transport protein [Vibrio sp. LaRot3]MDA0147125.1 outer membrane protein transport protein [Vibrio sp. LaRot3]
MNNTRLFKKSLLAVTITLASQQALAAGFQLNAQSATGIGRAFAGDAVIADNASVMARNPAAMALFDKMELSLGFESITSMIEVKDGVYCGPTCQATNGALGAESANYDDAGDTSIAPNIHLIVPVNEQFAWGVNAYTNFGTKTEFSGDYPGYEYGGLTDVKSMNLGVAGSYRINKQWSIGAGLDFIYGEGTLKRSFSPEIAAALGTSKALDVEADGWAVGFNIGTVFELDENNRFGLAYHYSPELEAEGDVVFKGVTYENDTLLMPLPDLLEFSGYHKIENTQFAVHYSIQYIGWNSFDVLKSEKAGVLNEYEWQNGMHYSIGGTYYMNSDWTLRAGYMHDTSAQDQVTSISVPDSDRNWFSAGFTYHIDKSSNVDFGFTYLMGGDVNVSESNANPFFGAPGQPENISSISGTTRADAILFGLQYSRSF